MFSEDDPQHPKWDLEPRTQRRLSAALFVLIAGVVMFNLAGGWKHDFWQDRGETVASLATGVSFQ